MGRDLSMLFEVSVENGAGQGQGASGETGDTGESGEGEGGGRQG